MFILSPSFDCEQFILDDAKPEQKLSEKSKQKKVDTLLAKYKDDEKFQEFLRVHKRNALDGWNNDAILQVEKEFDEQKKGEDEKESDVSNEDDGIVLWNKVSHVIFYPH